MVTTFERERRAVSPKRDENSCGEKHSCLQLAFGVFAVWEKSPEGKRGCLFRVSNEHSVYSVVNQAEQERVLYLGLNDDKFFSKICRNCLLVSRFFYIFSK